MAEDPFLCLNVAEDSSSADLSWSVIGGHRWAEETILCHYERMANGRKQLNFLIGLLVATMILYGAFKLVSFVFAP